VGLGARGMPLGDAVLSALLAGSEISPLWAPTSTRSPRRLYERHGFTTTAPAQLAWRWPSQAVGVRGTSCKRSTTGD
jgi:hypothetical protein